MDAFHWVTNQIHLMYYSSCQLSSIALKTSTCKCTLLWFQTVLIRLSLTKMIHSAVPKKTYIQRSVFCSRQGKISTLLKTIGARLILCNLIMEEWHRRIAYSNKNNPHWVLQATTIASMSIIPSYARWIAESSRYVLVELKSLEVTIHRTRASTQCKEATSLQVKASSIKSPLWHNLQLDKSFEVPKYYRTI